MNQTERKLYTFSKAGWWESLTTKQQEQYLKDHPRSKMKITNKTDRIADYTPEGDGWVPEDLLLPNMLYNSDDEKDHLKRQDIAKRTDEKLYKHIKLSRRKHYSIRGYIGSHYGVINRYLRGEKVKPTYQSIANNSSNDICSVILEQPPLKEDIVVFRGVKLPKGIKYEAGKTYNTKSFTSTTINPNVAIEFAERGEDNSHILQIKVPKGHKALYIPSLEKREEGAGLPEGSECELLLNIETKMKVLGTKKIKGDMSTTIVYAEILNEPD